MKLFGPIFALYVDPGSGSMVLQLLLGGFSGLYVIFRLFKEKILRMLGLGNQEADGGRLSVPQPIPAPAEEKKSVRHIA